MKNEIYISLSIYDANNEEITNLLKITPTKSANKGELITQKGTIFYKRNIWKYESVFENIIHLESVCENILEFFEPRKKELIMIGEKYDIELSIAAYLKEGIPSIHLTKELISFIYTINAEIDIDIYNL
ncbi:DUF4279 domain-containing protein [Sulfurimonas marina]|uniref:DUF4279 domain-containing protein n=1 Tax=Sulfurimonas marina TaxID=2590551 RepID=A0A7M1AVC8_9BACT|nr:DUF4279 domain-containing protein [Sulfurimonas marina]QOP41397.1 DUF4279 domain-containing protein [Sulfurimonas marina]